VLRVELTTHLLRLRTLIAMIGLAAVPVSAGLSFASSAGRRNGDQGGRFGASPYSALNHDMASLEFVGPLLLPIVVALLATAIAAADRDWGVLRYLYVAPVTRTRLLAAKLAAAAVATAAALGSVLAAGLAAGSIIFGWHPFHVIGAPDLGAGETAGRVLAATGYTLLCLLAMAAIALVLGLLLPRGAEALAVAIAFVEIGRRAGLTALLTAGLASGLLPVAALAAGHLDWMAGTFLASAGGSAALLALGLAGLGRPGEVEERRLLPPAFMRRLEEERRVQHEMDLLTRMQLGLLPARLPTPAGWDIAARSLLATEAGGDLYDFHHLDGEPDGPLWIAAGDVAGHGYSCAIAQAMTVSALASLVAAERTPAGILSEVDRVLRRGGTGRTFTTLALLRLDPRTGEALLANAGHPFPLLLTAGAVREIELPGLPLGQGPRREYRDLAVSVPPGGVLVLASDGLFEGANGLAEAYGFERPAAVVRAAARRPAEAILEALLDDWRRHLAGEEPADDTTVLVIKRR